MTSVKIANMEIPVIRDSKDKIVRSLRPSIWQHWLIFSILGFSIYLAFTKFGTHTITGLNIVSVSGLLVVYLIASVYTTKYSITREGILMKKGPFSLKPTEIRHNDITSILIKQRGLQKRFRIGNLTINTDEPAKHILKGIKEPYKIKELISREKASYYERRTFLRRIL
ncbi:MAG: PH domain-containing protein [wastewater metagenome]|nr:PH domain-containing protein [Candidatus Loosdrechtia aerotolerans]